MDCFTNRTDAGRELATLLSSYKNRRDVVVLALPRGGVPVAFEVARALHAPLDVFVVRKLGLPAHPELAIGAIASGGVRVLNEDVVKWLDISAATIDDVAQREQVELERRERLFRGDRPLVDVLDKTVLLIDVPGHGFNDEGGCSGVAGPRLQSRSLWLFQSALPPWECHQ